MAGTPYCRERKFVTSSSVRKPSFTKAEPRRVFVSFWVLVACCNCSGVMIFSLTRRSPSLCDIGQSLLSKRRSKTGKVALRSTNALLSWGGKTAYFVDTNCHSRCVTSPVTLVLVLFVGLRFACAF